jgi:branched-chain amino acid aminotransferase
MKVWRDGQWVHDREAIVALNDRGLMLGEGLFETMRLKRGKLVRAHAHETRLRNSCDQLALTPPGPELDLAEIMVQYAAQSRSQDACVRLSLSTGTGQRGLDRVAGGPSSIWIQFSAIPAKRGKLDLATSLIRREPTSIAVKNKTLSYMDNTIARHRAKSLGADMALMLDSNGRLSGTDCGNLFWVKANQIYTPSLDCAALPGTARAAVLSGQRVEVGCFEPCVLAEAQCVFVTNALIGAVPVGRIDGRSVGSCPSTIATITTLLD